MTRDDLIKKFMLESNQIEGEDRLNPNDSIAYEMALTGIHTLNDIIQIHRTIGSYIAADWVGRLRKCNVRVGHYIAPTWQKVPHLMEDFIEELPTLNSWKAHNEFEKIHPFEDLNGRVGRLIWLSKAINEGYSGKLPFLQTYYYQTLNNYDRKI